MGSELFNRVNGGKAITQKSIEEYAKIGTTEEVAQLNAAFDLQREGPNKAGSFVDAYDYDTGTMSLKDFEYAIKQMKGAKLHGVDPAKRKADEKRVHASDLFKALGAADGQSNAFKPGGLGEGLCIALEGLSHDVAADPPSTLGLSGPPPDFIGSALGLGGLGVHGTGRGSGGFGNLQLTDRLLGSAGGSLTRAQIERVMQRSHSRVRYVYERSLQQRGGAEFTGRVVAEFTVGVNGRVIADSIHLTGAEVLLSDEGFKTGLTNVLKQLKFPSSDGKEVEVAYPFMFKPSGT